jgi:hypothetical protein
MQKHHRSFLVSTNRQSEHYYDNYSKRYYAKNSNHKPPTVFFFLNAVYFRMFNIITFRNPL